MCSNPCKSELTCFRPESKRGPYGLLNFSQVPRSPPLSYGDGWITENPLKTSYYILQTRHKCQTRNTLVEVWYSCTSICGLIQRFVFDYRWCCGTAQETCMHGHFFLDKTWHLHHPTTYVGFMTHAKGMFIAPPWRSIWRSAGLNSNVITTELCHIIWRRSFLDFEIELGIFISTTYYRTKRFVSIF